MTVISTESVLLRPAGLLDGLRVVAFNHWLQGPVAVRSSPPGVGEHTADVLSSAGFSASEISALIEQGIVRQGEGG
ncbi:hypothetical protein [Mycolicibacterium sp. XJ870]